MCLFNNKNKILIIIFVLVVIWCFVCGKNPGHKFGDTDFIKNMHYAAYNYYEDGFKYAFLQRYDDTSDVYTHVTNGPEILESIFVGILKICKVPYERSFRFLNLMTAIFFITFILLFLPKVINKILIYGQIIEEKNFSLNQDNNLSLPLILSTVSVLIFSIHAQVVTVFLSSYLALFVLAYWLENKQKNEDKYFKRYLVLAFFSCFFSFWPVNPLILDNKFT